MFKALYYTFLFLFVALQFAHFIPALAQGGGSTGSGGLLTATNEPLTEEKIVEILCRVMRWMFWILIMVSVIMVLVAAFMYVTSSGSPESVGKANKTIMYAVIGVVVAFLAKGSPPLIGEILGVADPIRICESVSVKLLIPDD